MNLIRLFPIAAALLGGASMIGCTDAATAPSSPDLLATGMEPTVSAEVVTCKAQPYSSASGWIGPRGGVLKTGRAFLRVPPGALSDSIFITMESPYSTTNRVVLRPADLAFNADHLPHLVMSYEGCSTSGGSTKLIGSFNERTGSIKGTPTENDPISLTVDGTLWRLSDYLLFSTYAVVY